MLWVKVERAKSCQTSVREVYDCFKDFPGSYTRALERFMIVRISQGADMMI